MQIERKRERSRRKKRRWEGGGGRGKEGGKREGRKMDAIFTAEMLPMGDIRRTSKQTRALNLKHEVYTCCRFAFSGQMCNLAFQKGPETSNPSLRTKDNCLGCGITCVSHEKGDSLGSPWHGRAVLWAPPGGH